jgi:hypothetical protein
MGERSPEKGQVEDSIASVTTMRMSFNGRTLALQAGHAGSNPVIRSKRC